MAGKSGPQADLVQRMVGQHVQGSTVGAADAQPVFGVVKSCGHMLPVS